VATIEVDEDELLALANKLAVVMIALAAIPNHAFEGVGDKQEIVELGSEVGSALLLMREDAQSFFPKKRRTLQ
jgi:hypothetical protein